MIINDKYAKKKLKALNNKRKNEREIYIKAPIPRLRKIFDIIETSSELLISFLKIILKKIKPNIVIKKINI